MPRFYLPPAAWTTDPALAGDEARHFSQVLRGRVGGTITVFDGEGRRAEAEVRNISRDRVALEIGEISPARTIQPFITLAQAIPKGKNMDLIVQKAVELGVGAIQPLITQNTIVQPGEGKSEKWRRTALEACKQCGQDTLPVISDPLTFEQFLQQENGENELKLVASLASGAQPIKNLLRVNLTRKRILVLIGPEGDFSPEETAASLHKGFSAMTLGEIILRVETAALFCVSAIRYELG